jgi:hypothetical protein
MDKVLETLNAGKDVRNVDWNAKEVTWALEINYSYL